MIKILVAAVVAGAVSSANAGTLSWTETSNGVCAGGYEECDSTEECTYTGLGPCTVNKTEPDWHVATTFVGLAFVGDGYITDFDNKAVVIDPKAGAKGYRNAASGKTDAGDGTEYAYAMAANMFGDSADAYGYAGFASYLNTGEKSISIQQNKFYGFSDYATDFSTPDEYDICISKMSGTECGAATTFAPGAYKFSLFGNTLGDDWKTTIAGFSEAPYENTKTHMGFRMNIEAKGFTFDSVTVNGGVAIEDIGETDVSSITFAKDDHELTYTFPKNFNYGKASTIEADGDAGLQSGTIKVYISLDSETDNALNIDYLFPMDKIGTDGDQYFVYDPEVTASDSSIKSNGAGQLAASGLVAIVFAAVAHFF